ncbi:40S ribosomal protein S27-1-like [Camellia sinensis]|uniref:40S ribosomal protein S27-1-like n=1 Tax=Camellia sinensis TaxID=4442 RepID=UPI0010357E90|nr:40S ribosomal protein S27-1-like [Camellia sinensis]
MVIPNDIDLLNLLTELEKRKHKLKRLVQSPNSFFMEVKCQGCFNMKMTLPCYKEVVGRPLLLVLPYCSRKGIERK